ncbi:MAG: hypothetical protein AB7G34_07330 [Hyphomicrobiales bacterium]
MPCYTLPAMTGQHEEPAWISLSEAARQCCLDEDHYLRLSRIGLLPKPSGPGRATVDQHALDQALERIGFSLDIAPPRMVAAKEFELWQDSGAPSPLIANPIEGLLLVGVIAGLAIAVIDLTRY